MQEEKKGRPWVLVFGVVVLVWAMLWAGLGYLTDTDVQSCMADSKRLVPVGQTVGIKLFARGVMVVGLSDVETQEGSHSPAKTCGLKTGDIITHINDSQVNTIEEVQAILETCAGELHIQATRGSRQLDLEAHAAPCLADGSYKLGAWIRDSMAGIGTVTFYDPETGLFAALGHGINDVDTGLLMPLQSGAIMPSVVSGLIPGEKGCPGELHGTFDLTRDLGALTANTDWGVFGTLEEDCFSGQAIPVAEPNQVKTGEATILANIQGETVEEYTAEILRVYPSAGPKGQSLMVRITDARLLEATGGIVQGMSGSPILQDGKLVGALTHVLVNDPTRGYGIFAQTMLEAAE